MPETVASPETSPHRRVLLIGWDAADWKAITPLLDAGKMPNLAKLIEGGVMGNLSTIQPVLSPMLWTSIATGKRAYKHGIHGFSEPDPVSGKIRPVTNLSRKTKAIWNILNQNSLNTVTIGWWPSNPAEELSRGVMVSNDYQRSTGPNPKKWPMKDGTVHPKSLEKALADARVHPAALTEKELRFFLPGIEGMSREELDRVEKDPRIQSLMKIIADCLSIHSAAMLLANAPFDFMAVYFDAIDHFGHAFMRYHPPKRDHVDEWDYRVFHHCLEAGYRFHDQMLGDLLEHVGEEVTVILMSDHGFHPDHLRPLSIPKEPAGPAVEHRQFGIFVARGPGLRRDERLYGAGILDICPTLLHLFGLPVGADMDGKVLLDIYEEEPPPAESVPSWDQVEGDHGMHPPDRRIAPADSQAAIAQLAAMGYIDEPGEDAGKALEETVRELDYNLSNAYLDGGFYNEAAAILERLYEKWPKEHRFGFHLATCYQKSKRAADLRQLVKTIIERRLCDAEEAASELKSLNLGDEATQKAEAEKIEKMRPREKRRFQMEREKLVARARPNLYSLLYLEAYADFSERNHVEALSKLEKLDSDYGARLNALLLKAEILQRQRRWVEADESFRRVLEIDPESPGALFGLARSSLAAKDYPAAVSYVRQSLGLTFFQPKAHYLHGMALYRLGHAEEAEQAFLLCVTQAPLFAAAYRMLGEIYRHFKRDAVTSAHFLAESKEARRRRAEIRQNRTSAPVEMPSVAESAPLSIPRLTSRPTALEDVSEDQIITVVSGLPRSGTSLMMQILEAAGLDLFTDRVREADESNQKGYYEHQKVTSLRNSDDRSWLAGARGTAVKVVAPLLSALPFRLPASGKGEPTKLFYRVIYMEREIEEILASQEQFLRRLGKEPRSNASRGDLAKAYLQQVRDAKQWCQNQRVNPISIDYRALIEKPEETIASLGDFLGITGKETEMLACVDPKLYRSRKET